MYSEPQADAFAAARFADWNDGDPSWPNANERFHAPIVESRLHLPPDPAGRHRPIRFADRQRDLERTRGAVHVVRTGETPLWLQPVARHRYSRRWEVATTIVLVAFLVIVFARVVIAWAGGRL